MAERRAWITPEELAEWLALDLADGVRALRRMRADGKGPRYVKVGRQVRYAWVDVHAWCRTNQGAGNA